MTICSFYLQGRCKFGDKCWNEHPREGGGRHQPQSRYQAQPQGGQRGSFYSPSSQYVQPSNFSKSTTWVKKDNTNTSFGSFSRPSTDAAESRNFKTAGGSGFTYSQNRFATLGTFEQTTESSADKDGNILRDIIQDMEIWESSRQWMFSVYSALKEKCNISGFTDISQEELRWDYYSSKNEGHLQKYINSVQQLVSQWKQRILDLKNPNSSTKAALLSELTSGSTDPSPGFAGIQKSIFGSPSLFTNSVAPASSTFSFKPETALSQTSGSNDASGFGNKPTAASFSFANTTATTAGTASFSGFGSSSTAPLFGASSSSTAPGFGGISLTAAVSGLGETISTSVASGFGKTAGAGLGIVSSTPIAAGFGGAPGFGVPSGHTVTPGFGSNVSGVADVFKPTNVTSSTVSIFGQPVGLSSSNTLSTVPASSTDVSTSNGLFTHRTELSAEDLHQYEAKKFTLGKIPILPPSADLLLV